MGPQKRLFLWIGIGAGALAVYGPGLLRWAELKAREAQMRSEIVALKQENQRLIEEARRLREDPAYAEAVARREMGFVRSGETVIHLKKQDSRQ